MSTRLNRGLGALAFTLSLTACFAQFEWREFIWPEGGFSVLLPAKPSQEQRTVTIGNRSLAMTLFPVRVGGVAFGAGYAELPPGMSPAERAQLLADASDAFLRNLKSTPTLNRESKLGSYPAREFQAEGTVEGKTLVLAGRVAATEQRFYQLIAVGEKEAVEKADVSLFLGSLRLLK